MNASLEDRVYRLVAEDLGIKREKLTAASTLSHDLGVEGDDAVEFFERFAKEFSVDLNELGGDWDAYFSAEGAGLGTALFVLVPSILFATILGLAFPSLPFWLPGIIGFTSWMAAVYFWQKIHPRRHPQISIQDLVNCANAGNWTKALPRSATVRLAKNRRYGGLGRWFVS
jgi:Protein of unknown function (DUF1493)